MFGGGIIDACFCRDMLCLKLMFLDPSSVTTVIECPFTSVD